MSIDDAIEILNDLVRYPEDITQDQAEAIKISLKGLKDMMRFAVANAELAMMNATLIEFATEVSYTPYSDSNYLSLYEGLRTRATVILQDITRPTQPAPDAGDSAASSELVQASALSTSQTLSSPQRG